MNQKNLTTVKGLKLSTAEINLIDQINDFAFPALVGFGKFEAINKKVPVVIADKNPNPVVKTIIYTTEKAEAKYNEAKGKYLQAKARWEDSHRDDRDAKALADFYESLMGHYGYVMEMCRKSGEYSDDVPENWSGCYDPSTNEVTLFLETINGDTNELAATYVHEMFHAYFCTKNAYREIEEPITEYATLKFLKCFNPQIFNSYYQSVCRKKESMVAQFYGFGAYLYDSDTTDWIKLNMAKGSNLKDTKPLAQYLELFKDEYPSDNEADCAILLERALKGLKTGVRLSKASELAAALEKATLAGELVTPFVYDKKSNTIFVNGLDPYFPPFYHAIRWYFDHINNNPVSSLKVVVGPDVDVNDLAHELRRFCHSYGTSVKELVVSTKNHDFADRSNWLNYINDIN